ETDAVQVFPNPETARAYTRIHQAAAHRPATPSRTVNLAVGARLEWDSRRWTIINVGEHKVVLLGESVAFTELPLVVFEEQVKTGRTPGMTPGGAARDPPYVGERLRQASPQALTEANRRFDLVQGYLRGEPLPVGTVSERTLRAYVARYRAGQQK